MGYVTDLNTVTANGYATRKFSPNVGTIHISLTVKSESYVEAQQLGAERYARLLAAVESRGLDGSELKTVSFTTKSLTKRVLIDRENSPFEYETVPDGFEYAHTMELVLPYEPDSISETLYALSKCGANAHISVTASVVCPEDAEQEVFVQAVKRAKAKAQALAEAAGAHLGRILSISPNDERGMSLISERALYSLPEENANDAYDIPPLSFSEKSMTAFVTTVWQLVYD